MEIIFYSLTVIFAISSLAFGNLLYLLASLSFCTIATLIEIYKKGVDTYHVPGDD